MSDWWTRIRAVEPARVRAVWTAVVALLASLGVVVGADVDRAVAAGIVAVFTVLPLLQGEATRRHVTPWTPDDSQRVPLEELLPDDGPGESDA